MSLALLHGLRMRHARSLRLCGLPRTALLISERYQPKMNCDSEWSYSVQLSGVEAFTTQVLMVNPDDDDNPILTLTAPAREHAALIIANMNRKMGTTEWKVGEVVVSEYIDIEYTGKVRLRCTFGTVVCRRDGGGSTG